MSTWIAIVGAGVTVYSLRAALLLGHVRMPAAIDRTLAYIAPAALAALVAPALLGGPSGSLAHVAPRALALGVGAVVAHRSRSIGVTVAVGMTVLWTATAVSNGLS